MKTSLLVQRASYRITEIVEEKVPLSSGTDWQCYMIPFAVLLVAVCILLLGGYIIWCRKHRRRMEILGGKCTGLAGWNCWKLKAKIRELEMIKTEELMSKMIL